MKLLLVYPPFCPPTVPPHSITYLAAFLRANSPLKVGCLDLNAKFHRLRFKTLYEGLPKAGKSIGSYSALLEKYSSRAKKLYRENSPRAEPELFGEILGLILEEKPDIVGFSLVYNSQVSYGLRLMEALSERGIGCVAGGPAAGKLVCEKAKVMKDEAGLLRYLTGKEEYRDSYALDFGNYPEGDYLSKEMIYPVRSSFGCSYGACAFCTHHDNVPYREIDLEEIEKTIRRNRIRNLFFIDDNIPAERLSALADALMPLDVRWWCQTRPTKDLLGLFPKLRESGLVSISFGVESGNQGMLDSMGKGTEVRDMRRVLAESHEACIRNIVFVMFGFPGETEETFGCTMDFLRSSRENLDIVSASVFGLQRGSSVYENPDRFGVSDICGRDTQLGETIEYKVSNGLSERQAKAMKDALAKELRAMNRLPKIFCLLKEQSLLF